jgi:hypothetical protein
MSPPSHPAIRQRRCNTGGASSQFWGEGAGDRGTPPFGLDGCGQNAMPVDGRRPTPSPRSAATPIASFRLSPACCVGGRRGRLAITCRMTTTGRSWPAHSGPSRPRCFPMSIAVRRPSCVPPVCIPWTSSAAFSARTLTARPLRRCASRWTGCARSTRTCRASSCLPMAGAGSSSSWTCAATACRSASTASCSRSPDGWRFSSGASSSTPATVAQRMRHAKRRTRSAVRQGTTASSPGRSSCARGWRSPAPTTEGQPQHPQPVSRPPRTRA